MSEDPVIPGLAASESAPQDQLTDLIAQATAAYAIKDYLPAAELYSQATEIQAEINGEMAIENADLLYSYGKCLYHVAVKNSEVLGGSAAGAKLGSKGTQSEKKESKKRKANGEPSSSTSALTETPAEAGPESGANGTSKLIPGTDVRTGKEANADIKGIKDDSNPYFKIDDDAGYVDSDSDDEDVNAADDEQEEEEDDFANAYEVLDLSRVLLLRKLDSIEESTLQESEKGKYIVSISLSTPVREVKERIADVHDLQAEISLEGEKFPAAVTDLTSALALKEELFSPESSMLAECHYKLSLALEFSAVDQPTDTQGNPLGEAKVDMKMREEAAVHMEGAIQSCRLRIAKEEKEMDEMTEPGKKDKAMRNIEDVKELVVDMEQRLVELRKPPVDVKAESRLDGIDTAGILKDILGGTKKLEDVSLAATDLSGLVKKKKPKVEGANGTVVSGTATPEPAVTTPTNNGKAAGKRKVEFADEAVEMGTGKKAKVEDADDSGL